MGGEQGEGESVAGGVDDFGIFQRLLILADVHPVIHRLAADLKLVALLEVAGHVADLQGGVVLGDEIEGLHLVHPRLGGGGHQVAGLGVAGEDREPAEGVDDLGTQAQERDGDGCGGEEQRQQKCGRRKGGM